MLNKIRFIFLGLISSLSIYAQGGPSYPKSLEYNFVKIWFPEKVSEGDAAAVARYFEEYLKTTGQVSTDDPGIVYDIRLTQKGSIYVLTIPLQNNNEIDVPYWTEFAGEISSNALHSQEVKIYFSKTGDYKQDDKKMVDSNNYVKKPVVNNSPSDPDFSYGLNLVVYAAKDNFSSLKDSLITTDKDFTHDYTSNVKITGAIKSKIVLMDNDSFGYAFYCYYAQLNDSASVVTQVNILKKKIYYALNKGPCLGCSIHDSYYPETKEYAEVIYFDNIKNEWKANYSTTSVQIFYTASAKGGYIIFYVLHEIN